MDKRKVYGHFKSSFVVELLQLHLSVQAVAAKRKLHQSSGNLGNPSDVFSCRGGLSTHCQFMEIFSSFHQRFSKFLLLPLLK